MLSEKLIQNPLALCNMVRRVAIAAGDATLEYFEESGYEGADIKNDGSPVTKADHAADRIIIAQLKEITPDIPVISEESVQMDALPSMGSDKYFWLVDPLDGTKEFISGSGDYTVNIALIKGHTPVLGVVYAPAGGEMFAGCGPGTAVRWVRETEKEKNIVVRPMPKEGLTVVASRSHGDPARLDKFLAGFKIEKIIKRGSSLKICAVAAGKADLYPRLGPTSEWDTAAGDAVLRSAGGIITDMAGKPLVYGKTNERLLNPEFVAASMNVMVAD